MQDRNFDDIAEKFSRKNCVCWMLAAEKGRPQSKWPSAGIRSFYAIFLRR